MPLSKEVKARIEHQFLDIVNPTNLFWAGKAIENTDTHLRGISGGTTTRSESGKLVTEPTQEARDYWMELATARLRQLTQKHDSEVERRRLRQRLAERRLMDDQPVNHAALYRKMSLAEWRGIFEQWGQDEPTGGRYAKGEHKFLFRRAFEYTDTRNYRLWFSSSLMKCRKFENVSATTSSDVIMRFWFDETAVARFGQREMLPHKQPGVQNNPDVVAWHREEFAEEDPNISDTAIMKERLALPTSGGHEVKRQYNLGFTSRQQNWLEDHCIAAEPMY